MTQPSRFATRGDQPGAGFHPTAEWIGEAPSGQGLRLYVDVLRARAWLVVAIVLLTTLSATIFVARSEKVYEAEADLLVTPIPGDNANLFGLGLVSESGDPTRDAETLAQLITTPAVAERVRERLGVARSASWLLAHVTAVPVAQSSIVTVAARASDGPSAARLANAFGDAAVEVRTERMRNVLDDVIPRLREQLQSLPSGEARTREALSSKLRDLETLRLLQDPTLHLETRAAAPTAPVAPRPALTIAAAFIAALILGFGVVLGAHVLNPRIEREEDLRRYRIPIVGRIPVKQRWSLTQRGPILPTQLSPSTRDAYQRLASSLAASSPDPAARTIFISSASPRDGKTATALNVAAALAERRERVILVEGDSRRPTMAAALGIDPPHSLADVVTARVMLGDALADAPQLGEGVDVLVQEPDEAAPPTISPANADALVRDAQEYAEWLLVDGPALNYAPEALPLAMRTARLLLVVRLRATHERDLADLAELLTQQGLTPDGFIVVGTKPRAVYR